MQQREKPRGGRKLVIKNPAIVTLPLLHRAAPSLPFTIPPHPLKQLNISTATATKSAANSPNQAGPDPTCHTFTSFLPLTNRPTAGQPLTSSGELVCPERADPTGVGPLQRVHGCSRKTQRGYRKQVKIRTKLQGPAGRASTSGPGPLSLRTPPEGRSLPPAQAQVRPLQSCCGGAMLSPTISGSSAAPFCSRSQELPSER